MPDLQRQIVGYLRHRGVAAEPAVEAFHEAVAQLYKRRRPLHSRRAVSRWLSRASWHAAQRATKQARQWVKHHRLTPAPDTVAVDDEVEAGWETVAQLRAAMQEVAAMRPSHRDALRRVVQAELAAMGAVDAAEALGATLPARPAEAETSRDQARKVLERAQQRLRTRLREWLAGVPLTRWVLRRNDVPFEARALAVAATVVVGMASVATVLPGAIPSRAESVAAAGAAPTRDGGIRQLPSQQGAVATPGVAPHRVPVGAEPVSSTTSTTTTVLESPPSPLPRNRTTVEGENREPGNASLVCVRHVPGVGQQCVAHPLYTGPEGATPTLPDK